MGPVYFLLVVTPYIYRGKLNFSVEKLFYDSMIP